MSPGRTRLLMAMFKAWVALPVKTTSSGRAAWNSSTASVRQLSITSAARRAAGWSPRPGVVTAPMASATARATDADFCSVVAALSK